jgi:hypothetical protein
MSFVLPHVILSLQLLNKFDHVIFATVVVVVVAAAAAYCIECWTTHLFLVNST